MTEQTEYAYDFFISYADADRAWVEGYLLDALTQAGVRCHSEAAFALGVPRLLEFERAVQESQRTLLVLSPAYLAEGFSQFTDLLAQSYGLETATWPVIPLILQPVELPPRLAMLTALDGADPADWPAVVERLCAELERAVPGPAPKPPCPYPGMVPFSEADSDRFFGRDREVQELLERLRLHPFVTVIGPSGSGKSSLVFAGLVPALRQSGLFGSGEWLVRTLRPGESPQVALAIALRGDPADPAQAVSDLLATQPDACRLLLVVDQFEELFTLARSDVKPFQQALLRLAETPNCHIVLTVRADFYPDLMAAPLWREIQAHRFEVLPLDEDGLRQAIVRPTKAKDVGIFIEAGLVERLLADAAEEPGILPLLQETLVLLWERLARRFLPLSAYEALGDAARTGLQVAMARRADAALAELTPQQQAIARRIFLRLVQFGEGRADTRRQQPVTALRVAGDEPHLFDQTLHHLTDSRLLTLSGEERADGRRVDIAHEALIAGWPALQGWSGERREAELTRRRLEGKAAEWMRLGQGEGGLLDEVELLEAERWLKSGDAAELGTSEALPALVEASRAAQEEVAGQRRRAARFRLGALGAIGALIIVALGIGWWSARRNAANLEAIAERERQLGQQQQEAAATAQAYAAEQERLAEAEAAARADAEQQTRIALAHQLAAQVNEYIGQDDGSLSLLLAMEAVSATYAHDGTILYEADAALRRAIDAAPWHATLEGTDAINSVIFGQNSLFIFAGGRDGAIVVWDTVSGEMQQTLIQSSSPINQVSFSTSGNRIVTAHEDGIARIWDSYTGEMDGTLVGHQGPIRGAAFSPDGKLIVTAGVDGTARVWDALGGAELIVFYGHKDAGRVGLRNDVTSASFSPDGWAVLTTGYDGTAQVWEARSGTVVATLPAHRMEVRHASFSLDGRFIVTAGCDERKIEVDCTKGSARVWDAETGLLSLTLAGHTAGVNGAVFSPDGRTIVTVGADGKALLWNAADGQLRAPLAGHTDQVGQAVFSPDGEWIVTASRDGTAKLWHAQGGQAASTSWTHPSYLFESASPDGRYIVSPCRSDRAVWCILEYQTWQTLVELNGLTGYVFSARFSPDGRKVVTASDDGTACVWDAQTGKRLLILSGHTGAVRSARFDLDGKLIVTSSEDGTARVWDAEGGQLRSTLSGHSGWVWDAVFAPDGESIATGGRDATARIWDSATGESQFTLAGFAGEVRNVIFSLDARWLVAADGFPCESHCAARVWNVDNGQLHAVLTGHTNSIESVAFSPDDHWLVTASYDRTARVWGVPDGELRAMLEYDDSLIDAAFSPDGLWIATAAFDGMAQVWPFDPQVLMEMAHQRIQRSPPELTCAERAIFLHEETSCPSLAGP